MRFHKAFKDAIPVSTDRGPFMQLAISNKKKTRRLSQVYSLNINQLPQIHNTSYKIKEKY
jgi:hypothetical protein